MYIRMSQYCDKVVILKSVSQAVEAYDAAGNVIKGVRKSTTEQIATFHHFEAISHPEIPEDEAAEFEVWRNTQLSRIDQAFIESAACGRLGGMPVVKTKAHIGNPEYKVGEFSGHISSIVNVQPGMIKNFMNGTKPAPANRPEGAETLIDKASTESLCERIKAISEDILRYMNLTNCKGTEIYTLQQTLDMRAAWTALGCALDSRGIGYPKVTGMIEGRNAAEEGLEIFNEMKKHVFG